MTRSLDNRLLENETQEADLVTDAEVYLGILKFYSEVRK